MEYIIIEQTRNYRKRIAYDPATSAFSESEYDCLFAERGFTYPYGWLKGTGTPPGAHLDVFLMSDADYVLGDEVAMRIVGVFKRNDGDHKLISVLPGRQECDFSELPQAERDALYKLYPRVGEGEGWFGEADAREVIAAFMARKADREALGFCGIDCGACGNYRKNANCAGCREEREMLNDCPTRVCAPKRGHAHCGECESFPCAQLQSFYESGPEMRAKARENIVRIMKTGFERDLSARVFEQTVINT